MALALDGHAAVTVAAATQTTLTLTTTAADVIIVAAGMNNASGTIKSITDSLSLLSFQRLTSSNAAGPSLDIWYAVASGSLSADILTITISSSTNEPWEAMAFGVSGANMSTPFDPNASLPAALNHQASTATPTVTGISTSNADDFIFAILTQGAGGPITAGSIGGTSANSIDDPSQSGHSSGDEYLVVAATQSGISASFNAGASKGTWTMIVHAIQAAAAAAQTAYAQPVPVEVPLTAYLSETPYA